MNINIISGKVKGPLTYMVYISKFLFPFLFDKSIQ